MVSVTGQLRIGQQIAAGDFKMQGRSFRVSFRVCKVDYAEATDAQDANQRATKARRWALIQSSLQGGEPAGLSFSRISHQKTETLSQIAHWSTLCDHVGDEGTM